MAASPKKTPAATPAGVSTKIPRKSYATAQRIAKREQRTITAVFERAIELYSLTTDEGRKTT